MFDGMRGYLSLGQSLLVRGGNCGFSILFFVLCNPFFYFFFFFFGGYTDKMFLEGVLNYLSTVYTFSYQEMDQIS